jgi:hypothetical protein
MVKLRKSRRDAHLCTLADSPVLPVYFPGLKTVNRCLATANWCSHLLGEAEFSKEVELHADQAGA